MEKIIESYIDPSYVYSFLSGPDVIQSREEALRRGINCVSLAHLVLQDVFDYKLPQSLMCSELYRDREYFAPVSDEEMQLGDLVWFGVEEPVVSTDEFEPQYEDGKLINWADFPVKHVAICTGESEGEDPLLLHSTSITGTNVIWPMSSFAEYRRYRKHYGVTRLKAPATATL